MKLTITKYEDPAVYGDFSSDGVERQSNCDVVRGVNAAIQRSLHEDELAEEHSAEHNKSFELTGV